MDERAELLSKIDSLIERIDSFYDNNTDDCIFLCELVNQGVKFKGPYGYISFPDFSFYNKPLVNMKHDLTSLKQAVKSHSDFAQQTKYFNNKYTSFEEECEAVFAVITSPKFLQEKQKKYASNYLRKLCGEFDKLHNKLFTIAANDLLEWCDINKKYLEAVIQDDTSWRDLSRDEFIALFRQYELRKEEMYTQITELERNLSDSTTEVNIFNSELAALKRDCESIKYTTRLKQVKNNLSASISIQEKIDANILYIENNKEYKEEMEKAIQEYIVSIQTDIPDLFAAMPPTNIATLLCDLESELKKVDQDILKLRKKYNLLLEITHKEKLPQLVPDLIELRCAENSSLKDKILAGRKYVDDNKYVVELMTSNIEQHIENKKASLLQKAKSFNISVEEEVEAFLEGIQTKSFGEQIDRLKEKEADLVHRIEEAERLADEFFDVVNDKTLELGFTPVAIQQFIDSVPELKKVLQNYLRIIPDGFLLCIKDMALWTPKPSQTAWTTVITACEAAINKEPWAIQSGELYGAIYKYRHSPREGKTDFESYKAFKQSICEEVFMNKQLNAKKSFIETQAIDKLPHKNRFLRWLDATIKWLELKVRSSTSIGFFSTKSQKEIYTELNKISDSTDAPSSSELEKGRNNPT